jgi:hypothetical protein
MAGASAAAGFGWISRFLGAVVLSAAAQLACAQGADVGLVNQVKGTVSYTGQGGGTGTATDFMRVREADRFVLPAGALLRVIFLQSGRQETWTGPASFRLGAAAGEMLSGKAPVVAQLPPTVPQRVVRAPDMFQQAHMARLGGIAVRGGPPRTHLVTAGDKAAIADARGVYEQLRGAQAGDDITAQVYFASVLAEYQQYEEMDGVVAEMRRRQPDNGDVQALSDWVGLRLHRPK